MNNNIEQIGIDKVCVSNIYVEKIENVEFLSCKEKVELTVGSETIFYGLQYLKIKDNNKFATLVAGIKKDKKGCPHFYCRLDYSPSNINGNNLYNMQLVECISALKNIQKYLIQEYGIHIGIKNAIFSKLEINCNILTDYAYKEYAQLLEIVSYAISNREMSPYLMEIKKINKKERSLDLETIVRRNKSMELVVYDKLAQLKEKGINIDVGQKGIMRVEIKLLNARRIKEAFNTNQLKYLSDEKICNFFIRQFKKYFESYYKKMKESNETILRRMISSNKKKEREWIVNTLLQCSKHTLQNNNIPLIFDINDYIELVNDYEKNGHKQRNRNTILNYNLQYSLFSDTNNKKYLEIISKVLDIYNSRNLVRP